MEKYVKAQMEIIEFEAEDVIVTSCNIEGCTQVGGGCMANSCSDDGCPWHNFGGTGGGPGSM